MKNNAGDDHIPLDADVIQTFVIDACGGDREIVLQMIQFFLNSASGLMVEMKSGLNGPDLTQVRLAAHSLKSSSRMFSAQTLADLCAEVEERADADKPEGIAALLPQIEAELAWLNDELPVVCRRMLQ